VYAPLLEFTECLQLGNRYKDNNGLLATSYVNFTSSGDLQGPKLRLEIRDVVLQIKQSLSNANLGLVGGSGWGVCGTEDLVVDGHLDVKPGGMKVSTKVLATLSGCPNACIQPKSPFFLLATLS